jgi:hypothetical protein
MSMADGAKNSVDEQASVAPLGEPVRLDLQRCVAGNMSLLAPEEAAHGVDVSVKFAAHATWTGWSRPRCSGSATAASAAALAPIAPQETEVTSHSGHPRTTRKGHIPTSHPCPLFKS